MATPLLGAKNGAHNPFYLCAECGMSDSVTTIEDGNSMSVCASFPLCPTQAL